jgi:tetratricopeptide (TPR) repeat protein
LIDLGKAIAIHPINAENYYLRGDCHMKLGNYEQALQDYHQAELKGFPDKISLLLARGIIYRLLHQHLEAIAEFNLAIKCMDLTTHYDDQIAWIRAQSFIAFCELDLQHYEIAWKICQETFIVNDQLLHQIMITNSHVMDMDDLLYCNRMAWLLLYHMLLCAYMLQRWTEAKEVNPLHSQTSFHIIIFIFLFFIYNFLFFRWQKLV